MTSQTSFAFVMNACQLEEPRYDLWKDNVLRRATTAEISLIKAELGPIVQSSVAASLWSFWEYDECLGKFFAEDQARYFVISFEGQSEAPNHIESALALMPNELVIGLRLMFDESNQIHPGVMWRPNQLFHFIEAADRNEVDFVSFGTADAELARYLLRKILGHDDEIIDVHGAINKLQDLKDLPLHSPLRFLGYFALLESLLTHSPKPTDPYESITRQVKTKLALLNNRWALKLDYSPFNGAGHDKIWGKMYSYRSMLAHGSTPDFEGDLQLLGDSRQAIELLIQTCKSILRFALEDPCLIRDLREC